MINYDNLTSQMNDKSIQKLNEAIATQRRHEQAILRTTLYASVLSVFQQNRQKCRVMLTAVRQTLLRDVKQNTQPRTKAALLRSSSRCNRLSNVTSFATSIPVQNPNPYSEEFQSVIRRSMICMEQFWATPGWALAYWNCQVQNNVIDTSSVTIHVTMPWYCVYWAEMTTENGMFRFGLCVSYDSSYRLDTGNDQSPIDKGM